MFICVKSVKSLGDLRVPFFMPFFYLPVFIKSTGQDNQIVNTGA